MAKQDYQALTIEEHLRIVTAYLTTVTAAARLVDQPTRVPGFERPTYFAKWVADVVVVIDTHVEAVKHALPDKSQNTVAPFAKSRGGQ